MIPNYNTKMSRKELREFLRVKKHPVSQSSDDNREEKEEDKKSEHREE